MSGKNIVWLASYPKSGNTWTRIFLANYVFAKNAPLSINEVHKLGMGDSIPKSYEVMAKGPFDPRDHRMSLRLRGKVLKAIVSNKADVNFVKTHNIRNKAFGVDLIPTHFTRSAIYILRNPLDMVLSYARHYGQTPDSAAVNIGRADNTTAGGADSVQQYLGSWSQHVQSWVRTRDFPVHVMRYEDMLADPHTAFAGLLKHIGLPLEQEKLDRSIRFSSFEEVKKQEERDQFVERSGNNATFFHSGTAGHWKEQLSAEAASRIQHDHAKVMKQYGYL